jgi:hypothetical protein
VSHTRFSWAEPTTGKTEDINKWARDWPTPQQAQEKEQERKLLRQLANDFASLNNRVIEVRQKAPSGLLTNATLGDEYRALESDVEGAAGLKQDGIKAVIARVNALRVKAKQVETVLAQAPTAPAAVAWALGRPEACVQNAMQRMRDALNLPVPDGNAWTTAVTDLDKMRLDIEAYRAEEPNIDYPPALLIANKAETQELGKLKRQVDDATALTAPNAFATALPLLKQLGKLIESYAKVHTERELLLTKPRVDCADYTKRINAALLRLKKLKSDLFIDLDESAKLLQKEIDLLLAGETIVNEKIVQSATDRLKGLAEKTERIAAEEEKRIDEERQLEADRKSYPKYKFDNCTTWTMQAASWDNRIKRSQLEITGADTLKLNAIDTGRLGNRGNTSPAAGVGYHCHMCDDGGGGISFAYNHLGGNRVQPVIYDWSTSRPTKNDYVWRIKGNTTNTATPVPAWVKANVPPKG